jgi:mannosyltransferase OCH1-like enzyme
MYDSNHSTESIPKTIHYFWFGGKEKPKILLDCIQSWKLTNPTFEIKEWNESNFDISSSPFSRRMHNEKKWAFVADYARLTILTLHGGVSLDADMELVRDISPLLKNHLLLGEEAPGIISAGMIGATPDHPYILACKEKYKSITGLPPTIPRLMTEVFQDMKHELTHITVCPPISFYPYSQETIGLYKKENLTSMTYGVHLWNYSWGHPLLRAANRFPFYHKTKRVLEVLKIKKLLKKILRLS